MGTTSVKMARRVIEILQEQDVVGALLHSFHRWDAGDLSSDVDLVLSRSLPDFGPEYFRALARADCFPVVVWNYDINCSSIFVFDRTAVEGVQVDLHYDDVGAGQYGLRGRAVLEHVDVDSTPPRVDAVDAWLYSVRKRLMKQQTERADALLADRPAADELLLARASEIFETHAAETVRAAVQTGRILGHRPPRRAGEYPGLVTRGLTRLRRPSGFWVDLRGAPRDVARTADYLEAHFSKVLPGTFALPPAGNARTAAIPRGVVARLKPHLVISRGLRRPLAPVDLTIEVDAEPEAAADRVVRAMAARYI